MPPIQFTTFRDTKSPTVLANSMKAAVKTTGPIKFVAATNYVPPQSTKPMAIFVVVSATTDFLKYFNDVENKKRFPHMVFSSGEATVTKEHDTYTVSITKTNGALAAAKIISDVFEDAIGKDLHVLVTSPEAEKQKKVLEMVKRSHEEANKPSIDPKTGHVVPPKQDWKFEPTPDVITKVSKAMLDVQEYGKFAQAFNEMAEKYHFTNYNKVPTQIWNDLLKGLVASGYFADNIPRDPNAKPGSPDFILALKGPKGQVIRQELLKEAMQGMQVFIAHADKYLDKVVVEILKGGTKKSWSFWSGDGAKETALAENDGGVVLEGSIGAWFDHVWNWEKLTGIHSMAVWTSMSELYAKKAAEYYDMFNFRGYVGKGATREQSVFNKVEQPTFIEVLNERVTVDEPKVDWFVVHGALANRVWVPSGPSTKFTDRGAALAEVKRLYGE